MDIDGSAHQEEIEKVKEKIYRVLEEEKFAKSNQELKIYAEVHNVYNYAKNNMCLHPTI